MCYTETEAHTGRHSFPFQESILCNNEGWMCPLDLWPLTPPLVSFAHLSVGSRG